MTRRMYGDLLNGAIFSISLPMLLICAFSSKESSAWSSVRPIEEYSHHSASTARYLHGQSFLSLPFAKHVPITICALFVVTALNNARAFWYTDRLASCLAYLTLHCISICLILYEWPNPGDENIWTHVVWHFLIATTNLQQPFFAKIALGIFSALQKMLIAYLSPRYTLEETVPIILGATGTRTEFVKAL
jgi:hypothetical protein